MIAGSSRGGQTPLPFGQVAVLMAVRMGEPITYTVIFPFINQMIEELGVTDNPDRVGFYSGLVESVFAFVQFFTVYHWAKLSDRIGRKPVILFGLLGVAISGSLFGLSTNFWMMIAIRSFSGALNGNVAVIKASLGDITDDSNSTEAFAMYGLTWTVGSIVGNALGGTLSHPYERFPKLFGQIDLFRIHPYLLPCLVAAACTLICIIFCAIVYRESLPSLTNAPVKTSSFSLKMFSSQTRHRRSNSALSSISDTETLVDQEGTSTERLLSKMPQGVDEGFGVVLKNGKEWGFMDLMAHKPMQVLSATMFLNQFVGGAWQAASLLFFFDKNNGLGMSASAIGTALALNGVWSIACQVLFLTRIRRALGLAKAYKVLTFGWILVWLLLPLLRPLLLATETPITSDPLGPIQFGETRGWLTSIGVNLMLSFVTAVGMTGSLLMILTNYASPDRTALGAVNGIATAMGCAARVMGPSSISALFAITMDRQLLGGRLWWLFMVVASAINFAFALLVKGDLPVSDQLSAIDEEEEMEQDDSEGEEQSWASSKDAASRVPVSS